MSRLSRKIIAVLMLLWLPLASGSALVASLDMQLQRGDCHDSSMMANMSHGDMGEYHGMPEDGLQASPEDASTCTACGICHLACTAYLDAPILVIQTAEIVSQAVRFIPDTFVSHLSVPLVPPPLVAA